MACTAPRSEQNRAARRTISRHASEDNTKHGHRTILNIVAFIFWLRNASKLPFSNLERWRQLRTPHRPRTDRHTNTGFDLTFSTPDIAWTTDTTTRLSADLPKLLPPLLPSGVGGPMDCDAGEPRPCKRRSSSGAPNQRSADSHLEMPSLESRMFSQN